jgi:signal transduction histidine kinase
LKRLLRWLLPAGFRGQVAGILLLGLALSQVLAAVLYMVLLPQWQRVLRPDVAVARVAMVIQLLEAVPAADRAHFAGLWDEPDFRLQYLAAPDAAPQPQRGPADPTLRLQLIAKLARQPAQVQAYGAGPHESTDSKHITVLLRGGGLIQVVTPVGLAVRIGLLEQLATVAFLLFATGGLWAWLTWTVNHPLERFARTAERVGIDVHAAPLPERGPAQLKRAIRAFNEMQIRLQRLLNDRTLMLGAISHDLGTPLTRLRLRVETDRAAGDKSKMLADIETMHTMLTSAQSFIRGVDDAEAREIVDLDSLLQTVCDLVWDLGGDVAYGTATHSRYHCKPQAMLRALTNIVANAAKYGKCATVSLQEMRGLGFVIEVQDEGPGIPDIEKAKVFEPFYRTDAARETDQQGMGLGLSIARSIILAHGGTIELRDRQPRGLIVHIFLPESSAGSPPVGA